ncbi:uncharacterized protein LOC107772884 [Nicotiana tabacum]|uniref:Uncharacterized protein n=3 Tax=Nicotiana TaxID=4085 RepID=A0A1S3Y6J4_TOBAC|nr:PREDICTED: uncharacterized protein LOC104229617 [Nicotiana sylvestris]XP_016447831.1 PREDICTED: uncharacterized protein LOC107772884 [Nicotiana tabacum]
MGCKITVFELGILSKLVEQNSTLSFMGCLFPKYLLLTCLTLAVARDLLVAVFNRIFELGVRILADVIVMGSGIVVRAFAWACHQDLQMPQESVPPMKQYTISISKQNIRG